MREGVPSDHVLSDVDQAGEGALPALRVGIQRMSEPEDGPKDTRFGARIVLVSLADDVFDPWDAPCEVIRRALLAVGREGGSEGKTIVLLGAPVSGHDPRFGHVSYEREPQTPLGCSRVTTFLAKPEAPPWGDGHANDDDANWAWDCGTLVALGATWKEVLQSASGRDLDRDLLAAATPGRLSLAALHPSIRFDDFGVPGKNLLNFFRGRPCARHGNVVLGTGPDGHEDNVRLLCASGNVIITDRRRVDVYGLHHQLIIDSATTNSALVMPLDRISSFQAFYDSLSASHDLEAFFEGGRNARRAAANQYIFNSPGSRCLGGCTGLIVVLDSPEVVLYRSEERLSVRRESAVSPEIDEGSLAVLVKRQDEDPKLVEHLVHVCAIGRALVGISAAGIPAEGALNLPLEFCNWILWPVLLFHDFGGCLDPAAEDREQAVLRDLHNVTKLNRRHLDTLVLDQLLALRDREADRRNRATDKAPALFNDDVTSAVKFLQTRGESYVQQNKAHLLDVAVILLQCHDSPERFKSFLEDYPNFAAAWKENEPEVRMPTVDEVMDMYAVVRISDSLSFANWHWKREKVSTIRDDVKPDEPESADVTLNYLRGKLRLAGFSDERLEQWCDLVKRRLNGEQLKAVLDTLRKRE